MDHHLQRLSHVRWTFASDATPACRTTLLSGAWRETAQPIKTNARRTIYRVPGEPAMLVKVHHPHGLKDRVKAIWRKAGVREYRAARNIADAGVPTAPVVGCGTCRRESLFAAAELANTVKLRDAWQDCLLEPSRRRILLAAVGQFAHAFVAAGVRHWDMHPGNILVRWGSTSAECFLIDLVGAVVTENPRRVSPWDAVGWLAHLSPQITPKEMHDILLAAGMTTTPAESYSLWTRLVRQFARQVAKRWPGRRSRLLSRSSMCRLHDTQDGRWRLLAPFPLAAAEQALEAHRQAVQSEDLLKTDVKRQLSRVTLKPWLQGTPGMPDPHAGSASDSRLLPNHLNQKDVIVKEFRCPKPLGRFSADCRCWLNHYRFGPLGLPAARALAWLKTPDGRGYVILTDVGRVNLRDALADTECTERRALLEAAGRLVAWLHQRGIFHRDLKATNFVVSEDPVFPVYLVDCDDVRFEKRITNAKRRRGLNELLGNLRGIISDSETALVLDAYETDMGLHTPKTDTR